LLKPFKSNKKKNTLYVIIVGIWNKRISAIDSIQDTIFTINF